MCVSWIRCACGPQYVSAPSESYFYISIETLYRAFCNKSQYTENSSNCDSRKIKLIMFIFWNITTCVCVDVCKWKKHNKIKQNRDARKKAEFIFIFILSCRRAPKFSIHNIDLGWLDARKKANSSAQTKQVD